MIFTYTCIIFSGARCILEFTDILENCSYLSVYPNGQGNRLIEVTLYLIKGFLVIIILGS